MKRTYTVLLHPEPEGDFSVMVPALPGCFSCGRDIPEALSMAKEAIECHLLGLHDLGEKLPAEGRELMLPRQAVKGTLLAYRVSVELDLEVARVA